MENSILVSFLWILSTSYVQADGFYRHNPGFSSQINYDAPSQNYDTTAQNYDAPSTGYGNEPSGYGDEAEFDLAPLIIVLLGIVGLSLLYPTHVHILPPTPASNVLGRKRRDSQNDMDQKTSFQRALEIYNHLNAALEPVDKNCVEKIVCEAGALGKDVGLTQNPIVRFAGGFMPRKYKNLYKNFIFGENCHKIKCSAYF